MQSLLERFRKQAEAVGAQVYHMAEAKDLDRILDELPGPIARAFVDQGAPLVRESGVADRLAERGWVLATGEDKEDLARVDLGVTQGAYAVARTGSVAQVAENPAERMASMLPPFHLIFVPLSGLRETVGEVLAEVAAQGEMPGYLSFVSGPSRTADIERVLTIGVHGPSRLVVVLVGEAIQ